jgi:hypothetical protein
MPQLAPEATPKPQVQDRANVSHHLRNFWRESFTVTKWNEVASKGPILGWAVISCSPAL